ncbi:MAG: ABC transporter ATP-binding protein [Deltaproteobacteria bacterium]|nr:ABC transporter ATP-binding protein [Deltaproteobacteria bacterium]
MEPVIIFDKVSKSYHLYHHINRLKILILKLYNSVSAFRSSRYEALRDISFTINRGEVVGIIGKNGSGKSTTLGLIAGVIRPTTGKITVRGRVLPVLELGGGFHPELTGRDNILLNGVLLGHTRSHVKERRDEIIEFSGVGEYIDQPIKTYSSGMLTRLGFSIVVNLEPEILLIDEVLAVGDKEFQKQCINKMMSLKKKGVTMVFVSHKMDELLKICDRVLWINDHTVHMDGNPSEVTSVYLDS